jgi:membrane-bound lytic murein transglycosylase D
MTPSHRPRIALIAIALISVLCSCVSQHSQPQLMMSFLPAPIPVPLEPEPSPIPTGLYADSMPTLVRTTLPAIDWPTEVDSRIIRADQRFEAGKKLYQLGDIEGARREFNRAVDVLLTASESLPNRQRLEHRLDQLVDTIYRYDLEGLGSGDKQDVVVFDKSPKDAILEMTFPMDPNLKPKVTEEIQATASQLPLDQNDTVLSYIHFFLTDRGHKTIVGGLRRSGRYRPLIQRILDEEGVPQELIYLAQAESGFLPRAVSRMRATGMWQFIQATGHMYGLQQSAYHDDRLDPEKATRAAARHLHDLYKHFGDWYLAMAAFNCGCVDRAVQRTGYADYWELSRLNALPHETQMYVPLILAITIMAKNPRDYGLEGLDLDQPLEYDTLDIKHATNVGLIADAADRPVSEIQDLNPGLLKSVAPPGYQLHIPKGTSNAVLAALDNVPVDRRLTWRMHRVERGETLAQIAQAFKTPANSIAVANNSLVSPLEAGDLLVIPASFNPDGPVSRTALRRAPARYSRTASGKSTHKAAAPARRTPDRTLHHRASAKTLKPAGMRGAAGSSE